jgi:transposase
MADCAAIIDARQSIESRGRLPTGVISSIRGTDQQQGHFFSYISPEQRVRKNHPLRPIRTTVDKVRKELSPEFNKMYSKVGRATIPPEQLLRALLLQMPYSVRSERLPIEEIDYNILLRWFAGLNLDDAVWDATVFTKNRDRLLEAEASRSLLILQLGIFPDHV